jgi:hypothetical protein
VNEDPLGEDGSANLFVTANNNPIEYFDAYGLRSCAEICADAQKDPNFDRSGGGGVACEDGKKCTCAFGFPEYNNEPGDCPALDNIVKQHERKHFGEVECLSGCPLKRAPWKPRLSDPDRDKSECERKREDLKKLASAIKKESNPKCRQIMEALKQRAEQYVINNHCK